MTFVRTCKSALKNFVYATSPVRCALEWAYVKGGRRPWSMGYSFYKYAAARRAVDALKEVGTLNVVNVTEARRLSTTRLPAGYGAGIDERIVEYPWLFARLKDSDHIVLDAGSTLNHYDMLNAPQLKGRQMHITTLAYEGRPWTSLKPVYVYEDLRALGYPNDFFDVVACLSTLEHVGMDNALYTDVDERPNEGAIGGAGRADNPHIPGKASAVPEYIRAVLELKRVLKDRGRLFLTMPYGKYRNHGWLQVFDNHMVSEIIRAFMPRGVEVVYYKYDGQQWQTSSSHDCAEGYYVDIHAGAVYNSNSPAASQCVVCLSLTK